ncbi:putative Ig domain-containing protein [Paenibacillus sp. OAS669]
MKPVTSKGAFSGTPSVAGNYSFSVQVTVNLGTAAKQTFSVVIVP